jgi:hypothetical protein
MLSEITSGGGSSFYPSRERESGLRHLNLLSFVRRLSICAARPDNFREVSHRLESDLLTPFTGKESIGVSGCKSLTGSAYHFILLSRPADSTLRLIAGRSLAQIGPGPPSCLRRGRDSVAIAWEGLSTLYKEECQRGLAFTLLNQQVTDAKALLSWLPNGLP